MRIAVFGAAGNGMDASVYDAAYRFGVLLGEHGHELVTGGGRRGIMGAVAEGAHALGAHVIGVIPEKLMDEEGVSEFCDEVIVTRDLRERMERMSGLADGFCVMPGGFGTLYELFEVLTLNNLGYCRKGVVLLNAIGYYDRLNAFFEDMFSLGGAPAHRRETYAFEEDIVQALRRLEEAAGIRLSMRGEDRI